MARVLGLGEVMMRLSPPGRRRIEQTHIFELEIGGAELNTLVGLSQLGHDTALITRLPDSPMGRLVRNRIRETGVSDRHIAMVPDGRQGVCFMEFGAEPRPTEVYYDRADSAMSRIRLNHFDWPSLMAGADWFHVSGITPALSETATETVSVALNTAKSLNVRTSLDLNFRRKLWSVERASTILKSFLPVVDVLFASAGDAETLFQISASDYEKRILETLGGLWVASTIRTKANALRGRLVSIGHTFESDEMTYELVDRIGAGDAFAAGVIDGLLKNEPGQAVGMGAKLAAWQHTIPGDFPVVRPEELENLSNANFQGVRR